MRVITNLEIHLVHSCNLSCESCSHYSNQGHKGLVSLEEADRWMGLWDRRLSPRIFSLLGGEPSIHPRLPDFLALARTHWPQAHLRLVTNGFFLHRHPTLPKVLKEVGNSCLYISIHHPAAEYQDRLRPVIALAHAWIRTYGIHVELYQSYQYWTRRYKGYGSAMEPFEDKQPRQSWEKCPAKFCRQLLDGKVFKCAPLAYLPMQDAKHRLSDKWQPYLQYQPLDPSATEEELNAFFDREEEPYCGMCPANPQRFEIPLPIPGGIASKAENDSGPAGPLPIVVSW